MLKTAAVVLLVLADLATSSTTLYVDENGVDMDKCGNRTLPCRTIKHAIEMLKNSRTVVIGSSHFVEPNTIVVTEAITLTSIDRRKPIVCVAGEHLFDFKQNAVNI